jgi:hypothetical protein
VDERGLATVLVDADGDPAGVAWLRELGVEATTIHVFVITERPQADDVTAPDGSPGPTASPTSSPTASPEGEDDAAPGEEIDPREDIDVDVDD